MKAGAILLALLWFSVCAYAGYRLTERSFAWIGGAPAPAQAPAAPPTSTLPSVETLKGMTKEQLKEEAKKLTPQQMLCLSASISPDRVSAVLAGQFTAREEAAVKKCLQ